MKKTRKTVGRVLCILTTLTVITSFAACKGKTTVEERSTTEITENTQQTTELVVPTYQTEKSTTEKEKSTIKKTTSKKRETTTKHKIHTTQKSVPLTTKPTTTIKPKPLTTKYNKTTKASTTKTTKPKTTKAQTTKYHCSNPNHHCTTPEDHAFIVSLEEQGCPICGSHSCRSFYALDEWGQQCYDIKKCPKYSEKDDPSIYCEHCGKKCGLGDNGTCVRFTVDTECPICGKLVKAKTCHTH